MLVQPFQAAYLLFHISCSVMTPALAKTSQSVALATAALLFGESRQDCPSLVELSMLIGLTGSVGSIGLKIGVAARGVMIPDPVSESGEGNSCFASKVGESALG